MKSIRLTISDELLAAIDHAKGDAARVAFIEQQLRGSRKIKAAAKELQIELPDRPLEGRGKWERE